MRLDCGRYIVHTKTKQHGSYDGSLGYSLCDCNFFRSLSAKSSGLLAIGKVAFEPFKELI